MIFKPHGELKNQHALFSPSQSAWLRYDGEQVAARIRNQYRTVLGTEIHEYVASQIQLMHKATSAKSVKEAIESSIYTKYRVAEDSKLKDYAMTLIENVGKLPKEVFDTAKYYINDGIQYRMSVEQPLYYSEFIYGTADTISFRDSMLRIHDYKSGDRVAHMDQLMVYAALFCLEYTVKPRDIDTELRIYQGGGIVTERPESSTIEDIMSRIIETSRIAEQIKCKEG